jgi:hypothetical protein
LGQLAFVVLILIHKPTTVIDFVKRVREVLDNGRSGTKRRHGWAGIVVQAACKHECSNNQSVSAVFRVSIRAVSTLVCRGSRPSWPREIGSLFLLQIYALDYFTGLAP